MKWEPCCYYFCWFTWLFFSCNGKLAVCWALCSKSILINTGLWFQREDSAKRIFPNSFPSLSHTKCHQQGLQGKLNVELRRWTFSSVWLLLLWSYRQPFTMPAMLDPLCTHATLQWLLVPASNIALHSENQSPWAP